MEDSLDSLYWQADTQLGQKVETHFLLADSFQIIVLVKINTKFIFPTFEFLKSNNFILFIWKMTEQQ